MTLSIKDLILCAGIVSLTGMSLAAKPEKSSPQRGGGSVDINNGVFGDGRWEVNVIQGGNTDTGSLDPNGPVPLSDLIFEFITYVDVGANGSGVPLDDLSGTTQPTLSINNSVTSSGQFTGTNGVIFWASTARIPLGSQSYQVTITFTATQPFGAVRMINYLDEDVLGSGDDKLILINSPNSPDFQLLTIDDTDGVGIAHTSTFQSAVNATYVGWAASDFSNLRSDITSATGAQFSINGVINPLEFPATIDVRFPFSQAYGPADATAAFAYDLNPNATSATVVFGLNGQPNVQNDPIFRDGFE